MLCSISGSFLFVCIIGLKLMGFKPRSRLKWYHHVKPGQFIYPDENVWV